MKKLTPLYLVFLLLMLSPVSQVQGGFSLGVSPVRWEAAGKPGKTIRTVVSLTGATGAIQKVKVSVGDWTLNDNGAPVFSSAGNMPNSAASWISFRPQELSVYPRQRKTVRVSVAIPKEAPPGCYLAALLFEPPEDEQKGKEGSASVFIRGRVALLIYVTVGDAKPEGEILTAVWRVMREGQEPVPALKINNRGNAHLRINGIFTAQNNKGEKFEGIIPGLPLLPGQTRWIPLEFEGNVPPSQSDIELNLRVDLGDGERKISVKIHGSDES